MMKVEKRGSHAGLSCWLAAVLVALLPVCAAQALHAASHKGSKHSAHKATAHKISSEHKREARTHKTSSHYKSRSHHRHARSRHFKPTQETPAPDRITEIQTALARQGLYQGDPNGKWDDSTVDAMRAFQERNGLAPTGKLDALSLQKLGLGSDVAGLYAPRPIFQMMPENNVPPKPPGD